MSEVPVICVAIYKLTMSITSFFASGWNRKRMISSFLCFIRFDSTIFLPISIDDECEQYTIAFWSSSGICKVSLWSFVAIPTWKLEVPKSFTDHSKPVADLVDITSAARVWPHLSSRLNIPFVTDALNAEA